MTGRRRENQRIQYNLAQINLAMEPLRLQTGEMRAFHDQIRCHPFQPPPRSLVCYQRRQSFIKKQQRPLLQAVLLSVPTMGHHRQRYPPFQLHIWCTKRFAALPRSNINRILQLRPIVGLLPRHELHRRLIAAHIRHRQRREGVLDICSYFATGLYTLRRVHSARIQHKHNKIRSIFIDGLPGYHKLVHYFSKLCAYHLSALDGKWRVNYPGVDVYKLILTPWFHSLFSYPCLHIEQTARIWDLFLVHSDFSIFIKIAFTIIASNEDKLCKMDFVSIIDFCKFLPCMKYGGKQLIQKSISIKLNEKYLNYTRDLTKFDWQINKELKKEYILHKKKKLKKEREKEKIMLKYKDKEKSHINIHDHDQADNESTISVSVSIKSLSSSAIAVHSVSMNSISITESSTVLSTISNSISNSNSTDK